MAGKVPEIRKPGRPQSSARFSVSENAPGEPMAVPDPAELESRLKLVEAEIAELDDFSKDDADKARGEVREGRGQGQAQGKGLVAGEGEQRGFVKGTGRQREARAGSEELRGHQGLLPWMRIGQ